MSRVIYKYGMLAALMLQTAGAGWTYKLSPMAQPEDDKSTGTALTIDSWNPQPPQPKSPSPDAPSATPHSPSKQTPTPVPAAAPRPTPTPTPAPTTPVAEMERPVTNRPAMNEMSGAVASVDLDGQTIRLSVDGGFNPQFAFDRNTVVLDGGRTIKITDLNSNDKVVVRYMGKDLTAREIEKISKK